MTHGTFLRRGLCTLGFAGLISLTPAVWADGYRNPPAGGAALGQGGNFSAGVNDATANFYNPALLTRIVRPEAMAAFSIARSQLNYRGPLGSGSSQDDFQLLPNLFAAWPMENQPLVLGLAVTTPYGQAMEWERQNPFSLIGPYQAQLTVVDVSPALGWKISPRWQIGAGVDVYTTRLEMKQVYPWSILTGLPLPDGTLRADADGTALGAHAGLAWEPAKGHTLALVWRSQCRLDLEGDLDASQAPPGAPAHSGFTSDLSLPDIFTLAYGVDLTPALHVEAMAEWLRWSLNDLQTYAGQPPALLPATAVPQLWDDTITLGVGAAYRIDERWTVRAGYQYLPSPVPNRTFSPLLADADRHVATIGAGWRNGRHTIDAAYAFSFFADRSVGDNVQPAYAGEYTLEADLISVSYGYAF